MHKGVDLACDIGNPVYATGDGVVELTELLLVDDDTMLVNDELLKGLDKELDDFLKELLEK